MTAEVASRAPERPPAPPSLGRAIRLAGEDLFYNSWRVVPLNLAWGVGFIATLWVWASLGSLVAAVFSVVLAWPIAGLARLGALAARGERVTLSDALGVVRARPVAITVAGAGFALATVIGAVNVIAGLGLGGVVGWSLATLAGWGLVATVTFGFSFWPLLADPRRDGQPAGSSARLAALLVLAHPLRTGGLAVVLTVILALSTLAFAVLVLVGLGFALLVACRYVLPAADRLELRLAARG